LISGQLPPAEVETLLAHLEGCASCARQVATVAEQDSLAELVRQGGALEEGVSNKSVALLIQRLRKQLPGVKPSAEQDRTIPPRGPSPGRLFTFRCPACKRPLKVKADMAGKKAKCPQCHKMLQVPEHLPDSSQMEAPPTRGGSLAVSLVQATPEFLANVPAEQPADKKRELTDFLVPPQTPDELGRLGPYRVLQILGSGGMGVVYKAEDPQLKRLVALKAMLPRLGASNEARQRFLREAQSAAAIKHDHIVAIYQVGEDGDIPFLAMEFLEGEPLESRLQREGKLPLAEVLRIGREVALGLAAAHRRGMIHRDIKPANLWLEGEPGASATGGRVKILDFGLARAARAGGQLTEQGAIIGTPAYMAPEQAQSKDLDGRCDLFSLGCVLYRMATGRPAFRGADIVSTLMAVATENPPPPHDLDAGLPSALSDLIMSLMAKEPGDRPPSAEAVAEALERLARTSRKRGATKKRIPKARRAGRKWAIGTAVGVCVLLGVVLILWASGVFKIKTREGILVVDVSEPDAEVLVDGEKVTVRWDDSGKKAEVRVKPGTHKVEVRKGGFTAHGEEVELSSGGRRILTARLDRKQPVGGDDGKTPGVLPAVNPALPAPADGLRREQIPPEELAAAGGGDPAKAPPQLVAIFGDSRLNHWNAVTCVTCSPDGKWLATGSDGAARVWDVATGRLRWSIDGQCPGLFSRDSKKLLTWGEKQTVHCWDVETHTLRWTLDVKPRNVLQLALSGDERFLAVASGRPAFGQLIVWDLTTRQPYRSLGFPEEIIEGVAFSADGKTVAACGGYFGDGVIRVWDLESSKERFVLKGHRALAAKVAFSPDDTVLASVGWDAVGKIWNAATGEELRTLQGHRHRVLSLAFSPDGKTLATASLDGFLRHWDVATGKEKAATYDQTFFAVAFSPDRKQAAGGGASFTVRLWDPTTGRKMPSCAGYARAFNPNYFGYPGLLAITPDGKMLASFLEGENPRVRLCDLTTGKQHRILETQSRPAGAIAASPDNQLLASGCNDGSVRLWDIGTGTMRKLLTGHREDIRALALSPDGQILASASWDKTIKLWDVARGEAWLTLEGHEAGVMAVAFSKDGKLLATGSADKTIKLWDMTKGQLRETLKGHAGRVQWLAFSVDGATLFSGSDDRTVKLWDLASKQVQLSLEGPPEGLTSMTLSPDGRTLALASVDGKVRLRDAASGRPLETLQVGPRRGVILQAAYTPDGRHLVTLNGNGTMYVLRLAGPKAKEK
jgi:WD40 repeat protein/serine/threonine protein kinase